MAVPAASHVMPVALSPKQWERAEALFDRCLELTEQECHGLLAEECADDLALGEAVRMLIESARRADSFLQTPILGESKETERQVPVGQLVGRLLSGRFAVLAFVGAGGMGEVYRARDERLGRLVALKVLAPEFMKDPQWGLRFEREARAISSLNHAHICALYDVREDGNLTYLVMEYLVGETLSVRLSRGPLPWADLSCIAIEMAGGLDHAHHRGIIHRDLKPGNVMLTDSGVKILDFGLAKHVKLSSEENSTTITTAGGILGTIAYMSPEQAQGLALDARSDIFSFGCILYEMATGRRAFDGNSSLSTLAAILHTNPEPLHRLAPELPRGLNEVVIRCQQKSPTDRYQSMVEVQSALLSVSEPPRPITLGNLWNRMGSGHRSAKRKYIVVSLMTATLSIVAVTAYVSYYALPSKTTVVAGTSGADSDAEKSARQWLSLVDGGRYGESWQQAGRTFQSAVTKDNWNKMLGQGKEVIGNVHSRKLLRVERIGSVLKIEYRSAFANIPAAIETVAVMCEKDKTWRVVGYHIGPRN